MTPILDPEYNKMLSTPAPLEGSRKDTIDSIQKQIDFYIAEAHRLRYVQNSHVAISQLPMELLSDVFLYVIEAGLQKNTDFATMTFAFLQVCKRWNEVAIGSPQLWVWLVPGTFEAWDLFKSRSKDAPLCLTWETWLPESTLNILTDTEVPRRIRQLDFTGTHEQLGPILSALDSRSTSTTSSIRLQRSRYGENDNREHLTRFFSSSFPKLSKLDIHDFLPDSTSSILTTSNLTSLKLSLTYNYDHRYTRSQFLQVLQQHPNLGKLDLMGGLFSIENSGGLVPVVLPRLVDLKLSGPDEVIEGFIDLISMFSPLHDVTIDFGYGSGPSLAARVNTTKKLLTAYYGCKGLEYPRKATHLTVSSPYSWQEDLTINAKFRSTSVSHPIYNLELHFSGMMNAQAQKIIPLFPLNHVREYSVGRLDLSMDDWRRTFRKMKGLLHLQSGDMDIGPMLNALDLVDEAKLDQPIAPKLESLSFHNVDLRLEPHNKLLGILRERCTHDVGLRSLVLRSCYVPTLEYKKELEGLVKEITWEDVVESDDETDSETDSYSDSYSEEETEDAHCCF